MNARVSPHNFTDTIACAPELVPIPPNIRAPQPLELCGLVRDGIKGMHKAVERFEPKSQAGAKNLPGITARVIRLDCVVTLVKHIFRQRLQPHESTKRLQKELTHLSNRAELILVNDEMILLPGADMKLIRALKSESAQLFDAAIDATDEMFDAPSRIHAAQLHSVEEALDRARAPYTRMLVALGYEEEAETFEEFAAEARSRVCARYGCV